MPIVIKIQDTPSGNLLACAMRIMQATGCTMGEALDAAKEQV